MYTDMDGTESLENVKTAFSCESQARNRYTYFAKQARLEGDEKTANLFEEMANNEKEHAKVWYKVLNNGLGSTLENLEDCMAKERMEWESMYPAFAQKAREEGLELLAIMFENIASIEKNHATLFQERLEQIKGEQAEKKNEAVKYVCKNCGFILGEKQSVCPVCEESDTFEEA